MGDPRNPARIREKWDAHRVEVMDLEIRTFLCTKGILSGGWAWHYMSPPHEEYKLLHDHKDIDLFVSPHATPKTIWDMKDNGYKRIWTQYDDPSSNFVRFEKYEDGVKIIIDLFTANVPYLDLGDDIRVVEPPTLLSYYKAKKHTTDDCVAVIEARKLLDKGEYPLRRQELVRAPWMPTS